VAARSVRGFSFKLSDEVRAALDPAQRRCRGPDAYHGLNWGKAIVTPNRAVVWGAMGASCREAIHSPR
jgi:hypothetical protein